MRVLVVGAGMGGLAAGIALRRDGHDVAVVERADGPGREGFGITIPSNGTRALEMLGVLDAVSERAVIVRRLESIWHDEVVVSVPLDEGFGGWPWLALVRADLLAVLASAAGDVRYATGVSAIEERTDVVGVTFDDGTTDGFDLVVGADGIHSTVRSFVPGAGSAEWAGILYYRAVIDDPERPPVMHGYQDDGRMFGIFPAAPGRVYGWGALAALEPTIDHLSGRRARVLAEFASMGEGPRRFLERTASDEDFSCTPPLWLRGDCWTTARVALIGDAAHGCPPFMAEGACLAMEDAIVLADCLLSHSLAPALDRYTARRAPRAALVHRIVDGAASSITQPGAAAARVERLKAAGPAAVLAQFSPLIEPL